MRLALFVVSLLTAVSVAPTPAKAEASANEVLRKIDEGNAGVTVIVYAMGEGYGWANVVLTERRKAQPLFCPPGKLQLTPDQTVSILRKYVEEEPGSRGAQPIGLAILDALTRTFPCQ